MDALGRHLLIDMHECDLAVLDDETRIEQAMLEAARRCGATIVAHRFHRFSPQGVSGVVIIAESHLAIHTWPEHRFAAVDLFTCGDGLQPDLCVAFLKEAFASRRCETRLVERGHPERLHAPLPPSSPPEEGGLEAPLDDEAALLLLANIDFA